jgi:hypothetical protein
MADKRLRSDEDVVVQRPEDARVTIPVFHTQTACAGSAAAYLLRRIAYRAGAYAPGIQEYVFFDLANYSLNGGSIDAVQRWFGSHVTDLQELGYRLNARRVAEPTPTILDWVKEGRGYRGALLPTAYTRLHPTEPIEGDADLSHAVAVTVDRIEATRDEELIMVDPWPGVTNGAHERSTIPAVLESAHRDCKYNAIIFYWAGWS